MFAIVILCTQNLTRTNNVAFKDRIVLSIKGKPGLISHGVEQLRISKYKITEQTTDVKTQVHIKTLRLVSCTANSISMLGYCELKQLIVLLPHDIKSFIDVSFL